MALNAYKNLTKLNRDPFTCEECGHPQDTLCGWEEGAFRWVCPECYGNLKSQSKGEKS